MGSYKGAISNTKIDDSDYQCEQAHDKGDNNCSNDITCNIVSAFYGCNKKCRYLTGFLISYHGSHQSHGNAYGIDNQDTGNGPDNDERRCMNSFVFQTGSKNLNCGINISLSEKCNHKG